MIIKQDTLEESKVDSYSPGVISMLPLFYIGWSDSVLNEAEMQIIHKKLKEMPFLTSEDKAYLIQNTNPGKPPHQSLYRQWLEAIRMEAAHLTDSKKKSLAQIGIELAQIKSENNEMWTKNETLRSLLDVETVLGLHTNEDLRSMLFQLGRSELFDQENKASFDPTMFQHLVEAYHSPLRTEIRLLFDEPLYRIENIRDKEEHRLKVKEQILDLAKRGYGSLAYPSQNGGEGNMLKYMTIFETLAEHDLNTTVKFGVQFGLFGGAILGLGTEKHHAKYLLKIGSGTILGCFAMTESSHGSDVKGLQTTATYLHDEKCLLVHTPLHEAGKEYIGNALQGRYAVVFAQLIVGSENHGIHAIIIPYRDSNGNTLNGVTVLDNGYKMGLNGVDNGKMWFDNVKVPVDNLLNKYGTINEKGEYESSIANPSKRFFTMLGALVGGRICVGLGALSSSRTALVTAVNYSLKRRQFAPNEREKETIIMDYPSHQQRLIPLVIKNILYTNSLRSLAQQYVLGNESEIRKIETKAAGLKAMATWLNTTTIQQCREACGGKGYLWENRFSDLKADSDIFTTFEGDNHVLLQLVSKSLLSEFQQNLHDDGFRAVIKYVGTRLSNTLTELNPYFTRNISVEHLLSQDFLENALRYREKKMLISLANRMNDYIKKRFNPYEAFLKCQVHMIDFAKSYIERLVYRDMIKRLTNMSKSREKEMLQKITTFYALNLIHEQKAWYLEADYMDGSKSKAIRRLINKLMQEIRPEIGFLIQTFGVSSSSLGNIAKQ